MADARALLRAHRAENRIKHPYAAYSDAGKLLCKLCHEPVKTEALWDGHVRSATHRQRLQAIQNAALVPPEEANGAGGSSHSNKRKLDDVDESMADADDDTAAAEAARGKRSRTDALASPDKDRTQTPPALGRRTSGTPVQGVEMAIPSRPATPLAGSGSSSSTPRPRATSTGSSARNLAVPADSSTVPTIRPPQPASATSLPSLRPDDSALLPPQQQQQSPSVTVDESEWAAFEAEMAVERQQAPAGGSAFAADVTISAPALTRDELAAKSQEEENERRAARLPGARQMEDEREDATRALEAEFDEMEALEGRVRALKQRREELRRPGGVGVGVGGEGQAGKVPSGSGDADAGKENGTGTAALGNGHDSDEASDDEDEDDEWDGFRFRA
ncbi:hypothetical protein GGR56DRAFT_636244 [Xylariaceae sp. FL0804]|nr:hypothetical protein GGR56DRAFT_636244 [Xylariaceae sp. FL0804]